MRLPSRAFNRLQVDFEKNLVIKSSSNHVKLKDEINYYLNLPNNILRFFPKLIDYQRDYTSYTMDYIPYKSVSELILNKSISIREGKEIIFKLMKVLDEIHSSDFSLVPDIIGDLSLKQSNNFLVNKTINRIDNLRLIAGFKELIDCDSITVNDRIYKSFNNLQNKFTKIINNFFSSKSINTVIHGDFCFSNILYCMTTKDIKLIDPRGAFENEGILGNPYYDYAKIMHCLDGSYDYIIADQFVLNEINKNEFKFKIVDSPLLTALHDHFNKLISDRGINLEILYLIEATLFLSMAVLHYENDSRRKALYINGIIILNNFFERYGEKFNAT